MHHELAYPNSTPANFDPNRYLAPDAIGDPTVNFATAVLPYIYTAFCDWRIHLYTNQSVTDEVRQVVDPSASLRSQSMDQWVRANLVVDHGIFDQKEAFLYFPSHITGFPIPKNESQAESALHAWNALMLRQVAWTSIHPQYTPIARLDKIAPEGTLLLPRHFYLGSTHLVRSFKYFLIPEEFYANSAGAKILFDAFADEYESISDLEHKKNVARILFSKISNGSVLDVGCGTGLAVKWTQEFGLANQVELYGIDTSPKMIDLARKNGEKAAELDIVTSPAEKILQTFDKTHFDNVVLSFVDNYFSPSNRQQALKKCYDVLGSEGGLSFNVYNPQLDWGTYYAALLLETGFKSVAYEEKNIPAEDGDRKTGFVFAYK